MQELISLRPEDFDDPIRCAKLTLLGNEFLTEAKYCAPFDPGVCFPWWKVVIAQGLGLFSVVEEDSQPVGAMGSLFVPCIFTGIMQGSENFWFVRKTARNSGRVALRLLKAFEDECDRRECKVRLMIHLDNDDMRGEALTALYNRKGYVPAESYFRKVI